ncbi:MULTISPECIES: hypothetical protein [Streptomyces]|uniref:Integral membrane protein n=1 Tax=Streptomyces koelreuteriae TaxID=2838015 RepID=A0ABX8FYA6_9ACTN|nr:MULTISPECIES: hypothetical protein [Streptomyces]QWB26066.1 hypothetical protein KJK29_27850 [Streptomyces koelreuteriae]UUA09140.1 hypothetical protein NNW98_28015 [Streptomyces koelreuteriae]UUA16745.1 hypothetical protein NNW99_27900 [Streptomyces sp. CRCS-T-1]
MSEHEQDGQEREFDLRWADDAEHKEPSARARMLAARWKDNPPGPVPFRPDPDHRSRGRRARSRSHSRSSWVSTAVVFGCVAAVIVLLGYINFRAP